MLRLEAPDDIRVTITDCCQRRRIDTVGTDGTEPTDYWGSPEGGAQGTGFCFRFLPAGGLRPLEVETDPEVNLLAAVDAVLDLAIDGLSGAFGLRDLCPLCQYRLEQTG